MMEAVLSLRQRLLFVVVMLAVVAAVLAALLAAKPAQADGTSFPYHKSAPAGCSDYYNQVVANFPADIRSYGGWETAYWSPDLFRYTSTGWKLYDATKPWYSVAVNANGMQTVNGIRWYARTNGTMSPTNVPPSFNNLPPGYYAIKQFYQWERNPGVQHAEWQSFSSTSTVTTCRIT